MSISKSQSHGKVGEAAVYAKCWMHGIPAYSTGGLRANFAGSDLIVETNDSRSKLWVQVKTGAPILKGQVYLTQCSGENDLTTDKFKCDFVVFVNLETQVAKKHAHTGELDFNHLSYFIVPVWAANTMYRNAVNHLAEKPKRDGGKRKLGNMAVHVPEEEMAVYNNAWHLLKEKAENA